MDLNSATFDQLGSPEVITPSSLRLRACRSGAVNLDQKTIFAHKSGFPMCFAADACRPANTARNGAVSPFLVSSYVRSDPPFGPAFRPSGGLPMPSSRTVRRCCAAIIACISIGAFSAHAAPDDSQLEFFETKIRPVFASHCYKCHSAEVDEPKGGLRIDSRQALLDGGDSGAAVVPGDPDSSYLMEVISYDNVDMQMPPKGRLAADEIASIKRWISDGAVWPQEAPQTPATVKKTFDLAERKASHWCWQPVKSHPVPTVKQKEWVRDPIDAFILAKLENAGLAPAPESARNVWLRRVSFYLTGLPPTPKEVETFVADTSPDAYEKVVDRLLASPRFGERWARHWLDLARYAETYGYQYDYPMADAWQYRDYLIRAFNADVPYDQFVTEHIAGDLMPQPRLHPTRGTNESIIATGSWFLGEQHEAPVDIIRYMSDRIDNQVDVMGKTFLGVTLGCARCHDHKFDAISTKDVYSLWGFVQSSRMQRTNLDPHGLHAQAVVDIGKLKSEANAVMASAGEEYSATHGFSDEVANGRKGEVVFEDFSGNDYQNWFVDGVAFGKRPTQRGEWNSFTTTPTWAPAGVAHSGSMARSLTGALRSKSFTITHDHIWYRVSGRNAKVKLSIERFTMHEFRDLLLQGLIFDVDNEDFGWQAHGEHLKNYLGHQAYIEIIDGGDGYVAVDEIVFSNEKHPPNRSMEIPDAPKLDPSTHNRLAKIGAKIESIDRSLPPTIKAIAMTDGDGVDQPVYIRGSHKNKGEVAPRRFLEAIAGTDQPLLDSSGSGRLQLAAQMVSATNPLTARVMVNRIWHHLFGRGIVATTDNFGVLGELPTHPEMLDHLADRFMREGWSTKRMIRSIVLSNAFRMDSAESPAAQELDPQNRLLHRMPIRRIEGEAIRDAMLAVSGRLEERLYGRPVPIHLTTFMSGRGRPNTSGPLDANGRRSIYIEVRRNFLSPFMLVFDTPVPFTAIGNRSVSNVPAQALALMNDPFVASEAARFAERMLDEVPNSDETRIEKMYEIALTRRPNDSELQAAKSFLSQQVAEYTKTNSESSPVAHAWGDLAHVLFNCKEFIFIE
jgi:hypothetical protein